jgi:phospholipid transport system substrate-binding protein
MTFRVVLGTLLLLPVLSSPAQANVADAEKIVRDTTTQVIDRLVAEKDQLKAHPERIYDLIHELVIPHFDFASMAKWVLGRNWRDASQQQRDSFVGEFQTLLVRTYAKALLEYSEEEIKFLPSEQNPDSNLIVVKTEVDQPGGTAPIPIHYRMHVSGGEWKVVDVSVDGVSLVSTYRGSFASEIQKSGLDALIAKLADRNQKLTLSDQPEPAPAGN